MYRLTLPTMVAGRTLAETLVGRLAGDGSLHQQTVVVECRRLVSASPSFAAELVKLLLVTHRAGAVRLVDAPPDFVEYVMDAAHRFAATDRITVEPAAASV